MSSPANPTEGAEGTASVPKEPQRDAVCFTSGARAATFGAGVIHAYLAANRPAPGIVAGVSMGAVNAAALQRCYREIREAEQDIRDRPPLPPETRESRLEEARWRWYRKYLEVISHRPFSVIWNAIPDQSDFFADMPPVRDPSPELLPAPQGEDFAQDEQKARRDLYLFVKLGRWFSTLPISLSHLAWTVVLKIRAVENYPEWKPIRLVKYWGCLLWLLLRFCFHVVRRPQWFPEYKFKTKPPKVGSSFLGQLIQLRFLRPAAWAAAGHKVRELMVRPLFGWGVYILCWLVLLIAPLIAAYALWPRLKTLISLVAQSLSLPGIWLVLPSASEEFRVYMLIFAVSGFVALSIWWKKLLGWMLQSVELDKALVDDFHLRLSLFRLFQKEGRSPYVGKVIRGKGETRQAKKSPEPDVELVPLVIVAAPLQTLRHTPTSGQAQGAPVEAYQVWAKETARLTEALRAALAVPGLFEPVHLAGATVKYWVDLQLAVPKQLDLVDGAVIRQNPLPPLFNFLRHEATRARKEGRQPLAERLSGTPDDPSLHVVYGVPIHARERHFQDQANIVQVALTSMDLSRRRDTRMEVRQTQEISRMQLMLERVRASRISAAPHTPDFFPIFADEIAPEKEIKFTHPLNPSRDEILSQVAHGCRKALEMFYAKELARQCDATSEASCPQFLSHQKTFRQRFPGEYLPPQPGLPEVCQRCTQTLTKPDDAVHEAYETRPTFAIEKRRPVAKRFPLLTRRDLKPRLIMVASGGVFRGTFHVGMAAAMLSAQIRPHLLVGSSVGTLMSGALAGMLSLRGHDEALSFLGRMVEVFLSIDERVAFTRTLKNAARELGVRGRAVHLSVNDVRRKVTGGTRSDAGFAAVGAPPALIDALSTLFLIPHRNTARIAADFVAGHITRAVAKFLRQLETETLDRLEIEHAVLGASLLEPVTRMLLCQDPNIRFDKPQPFGPRIVFVCTTTSLATQSPYLLGYDDTPTYDFVQAALASCAFPAVFEPRRESQVYPGLGRSDVLFSDGGMFDNLPFLPALYILRQTQLDFWKDPPGGKTWHDLLRNKYEKPDLILAASLDANPEVIEGDFPDVIKIWQRKETLQNNVKIRAFEAMSRILDHQLHELLDTLGPAPMVRREFKEFANGVTNAAVLPIYPADKRHLNGTFHFCASLGMKRERVMTSIADGCFQTFAALATQQRTLPGAAGVGGLTILPRSIQGMLDEGVLPVIEWSSQSRSKEGNCPFFRHSADAEMSQARQGLCQHQHREPREFPCPFMKTKTPAGKQIYDHCCRDTVHVKARRAALP